MIKLVVALQIQWAVILTWILSTPENDLSTLENTGANSNSVSMVEEKLRRSWVSHLQIYTKWPMMKWQIRLCLTSQTSTSQSSAEVVSVNST